MVEALRVLYEVTCESAFGLGVTLEVLAFRLSELRR